VSADPSVPRPSSSLDWNRYLYVRGNPLRYIDQLGYAPGDQYIFVEGCVPGSVVGAGAAGCGHPDWGEYMTQLRRIYASWQGEYAQLGEQWTYGTFDEWAATHVHNVVALSGGSGADAIAGVVSTLPAGTAVHLFGHSMGGAAVLEYLNRMRYIQGLLAKGELEYPNVLKGYDARVKSAVFIDAADTDMPEPGFGKWAASQGIKVLDVDSPNDWVNHPPISGVEHHAGNYCNAFSSSCPIEPTADDDAWYGTSPIYNHVRAKYHEYTATHISEEAYFFIWQYWK